MLKLDIWADFKSSRPRGLRTECDLCHKYCDSRLLTGRRRIGIVCYICDWFSSGLRPEPWTIHSKKYGSKSW